MKAEGSIDVVALFSGVPQNSLLGGVHLALHQFDMYDYPFSVTPFKCGTFSCFTHTLIDIVVYFHHIHIYKPTELQPFGPTYR